MPSRIDLMSAIGGQAIPSLTRQVGGVSSGSPVDLAKLAQQLGQQAQGVVQQHLPQMSEGAEMALDGLQGLRQGITAPGGGPMQGGIQDLLGRAQGMLSGGTPDLKQFLSNAAGRKVYGGGRQAPNQGKTANKAGYARRDAMRSALAQQGR